mmetsp:Transcript_24096/g.70670  ORF Transcript_24096/g.70670 Transcript_24096/m.70670 type:complete len:235 (+) Transcript_24096:302-1006(+)
MVQRFCSSSPPPWHCQSPIWPSHGTRSWVMTRKSSCPMTLWPWSLWFWASWSTPFRPPLPRRTRGAAGLYESPPSCSCRLPEAPWCIRGHGPIQTHRPLDSIFPGRIHGTASTLRRRDYCGMAPRHTRTSVRTHHFSPPVPAWPSSPSRLISQRAADPSCPRSRSGVTTRKVLHRPYDGEEACHAQRRARRSCSWAISGGLLGRRRRCPTQLLSAFALPTPMLKLRTQAHKHQG